MARYYDIDGLEIDVSNPLFDLPINKVDDLINHLTEFKHDYMPAQVAHN
jgi:hypothetical protein